MGCVFVFGGRVLGFQQVHKGKCRNQAIFVLLFFIRLSVPQLTWEGDVILRCYIHWPWILGVEWNSCVQTESSRASDNWHWSSFEMLIRHNLPYNHPPTFLQTDSSACGGGGFWHGEKSLKGALSDGVTVSSHIRNQGCFSRDALRKKKKSEGDVKSIH